MEAEAEGQGIVSEQRISDEELGKLLDCGWAANGTGGKMYLTELSVVRCIALDLRDARAELRLREQGGAFDYDAAMAESERQYIGGGEIQFWRRAFIAGAKWKYRISAPSAPHGSQYQRAQDEAIRLGAEERQRFSAWFREWDHAATPSAPAPDPAAAVPSPAPAHSLPTTAMVTSFDLGPSYRERLRDEFALAFAASGDRAEEVYRRADATMSQRDKAGV